MAPSGARLYVCSILHAVLLIQERSGAGPLRNAGRQPLGMKRFDTRLGVLARPGDEKSNDGLQQARDRRMRLEELRRVRWADQGLIGLAARGGTSDYR